MILSIHQPSYFPWIGLLHKISRSDVYLVMDEVQLSDSAYQHRNLFLSLDGKSKYLTIPFVKKDYMKRPFKELEIRDPSWTQTHLNFLQNSYRRHPFAKEIFPQLEVFYQTRYLRLIDAVDASMRLSFEWFGINTRILYQSQLEYDRTARRGDLVIALCKASNADCYLSGTGAQEYLDESAFPPSISLRYNTFSHPEYAQMNSDGFVSGLSCIDVLMNVGTVEAARLLRLRCSPDS